MDRKEKINDDSLEAKIRQKLEGVEMDFGEIPPFPEALKTNRKNFSLVLWMAIAASIFIAVLLVLRPEDKYPTQETVILSVNSLDDNMILPPDTHSLSDKSSEPPITLLNENQRKKCEEKEGYDTSILAGIIDHTFDEVSRQHTDTICDIGNDVATTTENTVSNLGGKVSERKVQLVLKKRRNDKYLSTSLYGATLASSSLTFNGAPYNPSGHLMDDDNCSNNFKEESTIIEVPIINLGASVDYPLTTKWHIAPGINYSWNKYLIQLKYGENNKYQLDLHSIGVPINAKYWLFETNRWIIYGQIGLELKIPLSATFRDLKTDYSDITVYSKTNTSIATSTSIGLEYKFSKRAGIYIDGGVRYDLVPIRPDFPTTVQLPRWHTQFNIGVRFGIAKF